jgi:hypothetical protein
MSNRRLYLDLQPLRLGAVGSDDPLAGIDWFAATLSHAGDNAPLGYWQDVEATIPAVNAFDPVAAVTDELYETGLLLVQSDPDKQMVLNFTPEGAPYLESDGVDDEMLFTLPSSEAQPTTLFAVCMSTNVASTQYLVSGSSFGTTQGVSVGVGVAKLWGGEVLEGPTVDSEAWSVFTCIFNGTSSSMRKNGGTPVVGNAGANPMDAILAMAGPSGGFFNWAGGNAALLFARGVLSEPVIAEVEARLMALFPDIS